MQKELNPELFSDVPKTRRAVESPLSLQTMGVTDSNLHLMEAKVQDLKVNMHTLQDQMNRFVAQINEFAKGTQVKIDRISQSVSKLEVSHHAAITESGQKMSMLSNKLGERRTMDLKVQEMIDRHNNILRSFEVRMNQMQKVLSEKEAQLLATTSALNDAKMEIARLKRL